MAVDYSKLTDEELYKAAGIKNTDDYSQMSDEELYQLAGITPKEDPLGTVITKGVMKGVSGAVTSLGHLNKITNEFLGIEDPWGISDKIIGLGKEAEEYWSPDAGTGYKRHVANAAVAGGGMLASAVAGPEGMLALMGAEATGAKAGEARKAGASPGLALVAGGASGAIEVATEKLPLDILKKPGLMFLDRLKKGLIYDTPGELIATAADMSVVDTLILGKSHTIEEYANGLWDTFIASGLTTGGVTAVAQVGHVQKPQEQVPDTSHISPEKPKQQLALPSGPTFQVSPGGVAIPGVGGQGIPSELRAKVESGVELTPEELEKVRSAQGVTREDVITPEQIIDTASRVEGFRDVFDDTEWERLVVDGIIPVPRVDKRRKPAPVKTLDVNKLTPETAKKIEAGNRLTPDELLNVIEAQGFDSKTINAFKIKIKEYQDELKRLQSEDSRTLVLDGDFYYPEKKQGAIQTPLILGDTAYNGLLKESWERSGEEVSAINRLLVPEKPESEMPTWEQSSVPREEPPLIQTPEVMGKSRSPQEIVGKKRILLNASGESAASLEAQSRLKSEKSLGVSYGMVDTRSHVFTPLPATVDTVDIHPGPNKVKVRVDDSGESIVERGKGAEGYSIHPKTKFPKKPAPKKLISERHRDGELTTEQAIRSMLGPSKAQDIDGVIEEKVSKPLEDGAKGDKKARQTGKRNAEKLKLLKEPDLKDKVMEAEEKSDAKWFRVTFDVGVPSPMVMEGSDRKTKLRKGKGYTEILIKVTRGKMVVEDTNGLPMETLREALTSGKLAEQLKLLGTELKNPKHGLLSDERGFIRVSISADIARAIVKFAGGAARRVHQFFKQMAFVPTEFQLKGTNHYIWDIFSDKSVDSTPKKLAPGTKKVLLQKGQVLYKIDNGVMTVVSKGTGIPWDNRVLVDRATRVFKDSYLLRKNQYQGHLDTVERLVTDMHREMLKFELKERIEMGRALQGSHPLELLSPKAQTMVKKARLRIDFTGKLLVKQGLLSQETYDNLKGRYVHYIILSKTIGHKVSEGDIVRFLKSSNKLDMSYLIPRHKLTMAERQSLALVEDSSIFVPVGLGKVLSDLVKIHMQKDIVSNEFWTWQGNVVKFEGKSRTLKSLDDELKSLLQSQLGQPDNKLLAMRIAQIDGVIKEGEAIRQEKLKSADLKDYEPMGEGWGPLSGAFVRKEIAADLTPFQPLIANDRGALLDMLAKINGATMSTYKMTRVGLNPPSWVRNGVSAYWQMYMRPGATLASTASSVWRGWKSLRAKDRFYNEARSLGLFKTTWSASEVNEGLTAAASLGKAPHRFFDYVATTAHWYGKIDEVQKLAIYREMREQGFTKGEASLDAQKWGMDYSTAAKSIKTARQYGMPFVSYTYNIAPLIVETLFSKNAHKILIPAVVAKYAMEMLAAYFQDLDLDEIEYLKKSLPGYIKESQSFWLMPFTDKDNNPYFVNTEYFFPWGNWLNVARTLADIGSDEQTSEEKVSRFYKALGISNPITTIIGGNVYNTDPYTGREIYNPMDSPAKQLYDRVSWGIHQTIVPPFMSESGPLGKTVRALGGTDSLGLGDFAGMAKLDRYGNELSGTEALVSWAGVNLSKTTPSRVVSERIAKLKKERMHRDSILNDPSASVQRKDEAIRNYQVYSDAVMSGGELDKAEQLYYELYRRFIK